MTTVEGADVRSVRLPGAWNDFRVLVRERWPRLTSDDLDAIGGDRPRLEALIQQRYGVDAGEARRELDVLLKDGLPRHR